MTFQTFIKFLIATLFILIGTGCVDIDGNGEPDINFGGGAEICIGGGNFHFCTEFGWGDYNDEFAYCESTDDLSLDFAQDWCPGLHRSTDNALSFIINTEIDSWDSMTLIVDYKEKGGDWIYGNEVTLVQDYRQFDGRAFLSTPMPPMEGDMEVSGYIEYTLASGERVTSDLFCENSGSETLTVLQNGSALDVDRRDYGGCHIQFDFNDAGTGEEPII